MSLTSQTSQLNALSLIIGSVSVIVALAWNNAITSIISYYLPDEATGKSMKAKVAYAVILTIIAGIFAKFINRYSGKIQLGI